MDLDYELTLGGAICAQGGGSVECGVGNHIVVPVALERSRLSLWVSETICPVPVPRSLLPALACVTATIGVPWNRRLRTYSQTLAFSSLPLSYYEIQVN